MQPLQETRPLGSSTVAVCTRVLQRYAAQEDRIKAAVLQEGLLFRLTQRANTAAALDYFERLYPTSRYSAEVGALRDELGYSLARDSNTVTAYQAFLKKFPASRRADSVRLRIEDLRRDAARALVAVRRVKVIRPDVLMLSAHGPRSSGVPNGWYEEVAGRIDNELHPLLRQTYRQAGFDVVDSGEDATLVVDFRGYALYLPAGFIMLGQPAFAVNVSLQHPTYGALFQASVSASIADDNHGPERFFDPDGKLRFDVVLQEVRLRVGALRPPRR